MKPGDLVPSSRSSVPCIGQSGPERRRRAPGCPSSTGPPSVAGCVGRKSELEDHQVSTLCADGCDKKNVKRKWLRLTSIDFAFHVGRLGPDGAAAGVSLDLLLEFCQKNVTSVVVGLEIGIDLVCLVDGVNGFLHFPEARRDGIVSIGISKREGGKHQE